MRILMDEARVLTMADAVAVMRGALKARPGGRLVSPPRAGVIADGVGLPWRAGALHGRGGLRLYMTGVLETALPVEPASSPEHVAWAADAPMGRAFGLATGVPVNALGCMIHDAQASGCDGAHGAVYLRHLRTVSRRAGLSATPPHAERRRDLAAGMAARSPRGPAAAALLLSHGRPGTEVAFLAWAAEAAGVGAVLADGTW